MFMGDKVQSTGLGQVISASTRFKMIPITELRFTTLNTNSVLTHLELSNSADFLEQKNSFDSNQVSDSTTMPQAMSQIPLFLHP